MNYLIIIIAKIKMQRKMRSDFNERAINCYKKVGFKEYGRRRESYFLDGKYYDHIYMDILDREFEGNYIKNRNI